MPWTEIIRPHYRRVTRGYASDLTDAEWALLLPFMPQPSRPGRPRKTHLRRVVDALLYIASAGCRTHPRSVSAVQPIFAAIEPMAAHCEL